MVEMSMNLGQRMSMDQRMILAPRMIQSMEILQLPIMALQEKIQQELQENPFLESRETSDEAPAAADEEVADPVVEEKAADPDGELVINEQAGDELDFNRLEALSRDWEDHFNEEHRPSRNGMDEEGDKKHDAMQNMPSRPMSLHDYLTDQLGFLEGDADILRLAKHIVSFVDDNGKLTVTLPDIVENYDLLTNLDQAEEALAIVQKLDPPGVGFRDLQECLLLQLNSETPHRDMVRLLILNHLEDIQHNRLPVIQRRTGFDIPTIKEGIEILKRFDPRPGSRFMAEHVPYVVPDIVVERNESGEYDVRLLDDWVPSIFINRRNVELYKSLCKEKSANPLTDNPNDPKVKARKFLRDKIQAAQWLMDSIEQRRSTLEKVTRAIIQHQRAFLDKGPEHIEPLKMQQIADQVHVHVTTVSRAVDDKWVQTPRGIFSLKRFFGGGAKNEVTGEDVAYETIKNKLKEIIEKEDKANPLSDEDLVTKLNEAGYPVARRTVTKYRKMLHIPSSRQRKDWAVCGAVDGKVPSEE
jgi:RNA polymerase sigma-54 factor